MSNYSGQTWQQPAPTPPPPPAKKSSAKRILIIAAIVIGGIIVFGSCISALEGDPASAPAPTATVTVTETATETVSAAAPEPEPTTKAPAPKPEPKPATTMDEGTYEVGVDAPAGRYKAVGEDNCYWERTKDDSGSFGSILANANVNDGARASVTVKKGEFFTSSGCGTWTKVG